MRATGAGYDAEPCLGQPDDSGGGEDAEMGAQGELETTAERQRRDGRYGRDR